MKSARDARGRHGQFSAAERFWAKVDGGDVTTCWVWGATTSNGYGKFRGEAGLVNAHKWAYEAMIGPVPDGLHLDHLCRVRACVNPWHLDPVTPLVNVRRSPITHGNETHCPEGHPYAGENLRRYAGRRYCRTCSIKRSREWHARHKAGERAGVDRRAAA